MQKIKCEMCGSSDLKKEDGVFVCQNCGMKYTLEEAKKMMVEGTVKIDDSDEIEKLYQAAHNSLSALDYVMALKHYEKLSEKDPNSWEAIFYSVILKTKSIKNGEIATAIAKISTCYASVFQLIKEYVFDDEKKKSATKIVVDETFKALDFLYGASENFNKTLTKGNGALAFTGILGLTTSLKSTSEAGVELKNRAFSIANCCWACGNTISAQMGLEDDYYKSEAVRCWEKAFNYNQSFKLNHHKTNLFTDESLDRLVNLIKENDPSYIESHKSEIENMKETGGCYVATCVYGSYDCPEVWVLRRYRDNKLAKTKRGRLFIKTYYAISPTLVKLFGKRKWFKNMWKPKLDKMVKNLREEGVEDTPYEDQSW